MRDEIKKALSLRSTRKEGVDFCGNRVIIGDFVAFNDGNYRGKTVITLGIVCGFTDKSARVITDKLKVTTFTDEKLILYNKDVTMKLKTLNSDFIDVVNTITLPKKMEII